MTLYPVAFLSSIARFHKYFPLLLPQEFVEILDLAALNLNDEFISLVNFKSHFAIILPLLLSDFF